MGAPKQHVVVQGECLSSIARSYGFEEWRVLYDLPENAELKAIRPNPNALVPGDRVAIPERLPFQMTGAIGSWHTIKVKREKARLRVRLRDLQGETIANKNYTLVIAGTRRDGTTDGDGLVDEAVPATVDTVSIEIALDEEAPDAITTWRLRVGSLNPAHDVSGAQGRLRNLGLYFGPLDGKRNDELRAALREFQLLHSLEITGDLDDETTSALGAAHDEAS